MFGKKTKKTTSTKNQKKTDKPKQKSSKEGEVSPSLQPAKQSSATLSAASGAGRNAAETIYVANEEHYEQVIEKIKNVKKTLWIGTADIKDLYVKDGKNTKPLLEVLSDLVKKGVEIRLIHAKEPGPAFRQDFDKYPHLIDGMERALCPRVHFKIIIYDQKEAYVGSANLTGAGLGMKGENTRNFEAGVLSSNKDFVSHAATQFDEVWMGSFCKTCKRKQFCSDPIVP